jgi:hypothetical protein
MKVLASLLVAALLAACAVTPPGPVLGDPALPLAGRVLGSAIHTRDAEELQYYVRKALADRYAERERIVATREERQAHASQVRDTVAAKTGVAPVRSPEEDALREEIAGAFILQWKVNASLYRRYGGRIAWQQGGPDPVDAWRRFLEESRARGDFAILRPELEAPFWRYYRSDTRHSFYPAGSAEATRAFAVPPWQRP